MYIYIYIYNSYIYTHTFLPLCMCIVSFIMYILENSSIFHIIFSQMFLVLLGQSLIQKGFTA